MEKSVKDKITLANNLMQGIESLNNKINIYEDFKNNKDLKCKITRPESRDKNDWTYVDTINIDDIEIIIDAIDNVLYRLQLEVEAKELELENLSI
jgi:hypothetical protein